MPETTAGRIAMLVAWAMLIALAFVTLSPIGLRPLTPFGPTAERFAAFVVVGILFAIAYPRRFWLVALLVVVAIGLLEVLQLVVPGRHGTARDLVVKVAGAVIGLAAGRFASLRLGRHNKETNR
jgi:glycopeptide antibiotics resistance protein